MTVKYVLLLGLGFVIYSGPLQGCELSYALTAIKFATGDDLIVPECRNLNDPMLQQEPSEALSFFRDLGKHTDLTISIMKGADHHRVKLSHGELLFINNAHWTPEKANILIRIVEESSGTELLMVSGNYVLYFEINADRICYAGAPVIFE